MLSRDGGATAALLDDFERFLNPDVLATFSTDDLDKTVAYVVQAMMLALLDGASVAMFCAVEQVGVLCRAKLQPTK